MRTLAYLDLSTASQISALIAGGFAAAVVALKTYFKRLLVFLRIRKPDEEPAVDTGSGSKQPDTT